MNTSEVAAWLAGRLPADWFTGPVEVSVDREEISITGVLTDPQLAADASKEARRAAAVGRVKEFRERTRDARIEIARELEARTGRHVAWGAEALGEQMLFTNMSIPVMTRLRQPERRTLDTLVEAGVARSRSEALAWCVRLVGEHADEWLTTLRAALADVEKARDKGPLATG